MQVILLKDVRRVGSAHDIKDVADGFAYNFLIPQKLAEIATPEKLKEVEAQKAKREAERQEQEKQLDTKVAALRGKSVTIAAKATDKGGLFKGIVEKDIALAIRGQHSLEIAEDIIGLSAPIKTVGEHKVSLTSKNEKAELAVVVSAA